MNVPLQENNSDGTFSQRANAGKIVSSKLVKFSSSFFFLHFDIRYTYTFRNVYFFKSILKAKVNSCADKHNVIRIKAF